MNRLERPFAASGLSLCRARNTYFYTAVPESRDEWGKLFTDMKIQLKI